jgi:hypothetical protein
MKVAEISLRPANDGDFDFLWWLHMRRPVSSGLDRDKVQ